jgi:hypothetical protein
MPIETGGHTVTAGDVALLPFGLSIGRKNDLLPFGLWPSYRAEPDRRYNVNLQIWVERANAVVPGVVIMLAELTGSVGFDWGMVLGHIVQGMGSRPVVHCGNVEHGLVACFLPTSVIADDIIRWRVKYDKTPLPGNRIDTLYVPDIVKGRTLYKSTTATSIGAGATNNVFRPALGQLWVVRYLAALQDDGAVSCNWQWTDAISSGVTLLPDVTLAANTILPYGAYDDNQPPLLQLPIQLTYYNYLTFIFAASAAGKHSYTRALVEEYNGVEAS